MGDDRLQAYFDSFPSGYRFEPRDEELVVHYLSNKVQNKPLPLNRILDINVYAHNPDKLHEMLPNYGEEIRYYLTPRTKKYPKGKRPKRSAGTGYWKATGTGKKVLAGNVQVGTKTTLVFYQGTHKKATKTNWIMQEYTLFEENPELRQYEDENLLNDWVLCKIYYNNRSVNNGDTILAALGEIDEPENEKVDEEPFHVEDGYLVDYQQELVETGNDQEIIVGLMNKSPDKNYQVEENWIKEDDISFLASGQNSEYLGIRSELMQMNKNNQEEGILLEKEDIFVSKPVQVENALPIRHQPVQSAPMDNSSTDVNEQREEQLSYVFDPLPWEIPCYRTWQPSYRF